MKNKKYFRGEVYSVDFGIGKGSVQGGLRPAVIVQNNIGNIHSPTVLVAPLTSKNKRELPTHVKFSGTERSSCSGTIMLEQIFTVNKFELLKCLGDCSEECLEKVDEALKISFHL